MRGLNKLAVVSLIALGVPALGAGSSFAADPDGLAEAGVLKVGIIPAEDARAVVRQNRKTLWTRLARP